MDLLFTVHSSYILLPMVLFKGGSCQLGLCSGTTSCHPSLFRFLSLHFIIMLYVWVTNLLKKKNSETDMPLTHGIVFILVCNHLHILTLNNIRFYASRIHDWKRIKWTVLFFSGSWILDQSITITKPNVNVSQCSVSGWLHLNCSSVGT